MQIVIDVDEKTYTRIKTALIINAGNTFYNEILTSVAEGIPLPKGHGRLIDADDLIQDIMNDNKLCIFNSESERIIHDEMVDFAVDRIAYASTIIEADKSEVD